MASQGALIDFTQISRVRADLQAIKEQISAIVDPYLRNIVEKYLDYRLTGYPHDYTLRCLADHSDIQQLPPFLEGVVKTYCKVD